MFDKLSHLADADGAKRLLLADPAMATILPWPAGAEDLDTDADWRRFCQTDSARAKSPQ
jgi:hypothetical protein